LQKPDRRVGILLTMLAFAMIGLAYASVPIYRIFCQKTGYGGTPRIAHHASQTVINKEITVQFSATTHRDIPWKFVPLQNEIKVKIGQNMLAYYRAQNNASVPITGMATYNVSPDKASIYFHKVHCFCFEEQLLKPGESIDMPVYFFLDPEYAKDPLTKDIKVITLAYTFFKFNK